ncbi:hypothetical protein BX600DRAFT_495474 [Xylariales sp. PMI_506]|nr:hypothetical protein BX600DRAFT_495474 [Xylariales sp. PMI_506]
MDIVRRILRFRTHLSHVNKAETDDVYPIHPLDDQENFRNIMLGLTLRFNDVLDAEKLHEALSRLLEHGDWRKLGGRYRLNSKGRLVIHVPKVFSWKRPAVKFSQQKFDITISEHPLASRLPIVTDQPSIQAATTEFRDFVARPDAPKTIQDLINSDDPQISLHITSFKDATLVGFLIPHTTTDIMGISGIMHAWSLVLSGHEAEIPPLQGIWNNIPDEIITCYDHKREPLVLAAKQLKGLKRVLMGLNFLWDLYLGPKMESKTVFLPRRFVSQLHSRAVNDLSAACGTTKPPFISEGDVLAAWATHAMAGSTQLRHRPIDTIVLVDFRRLRRFFDPKTVYIQNLITYAHALFTTQQILGSSLGDRAYKIRQDILAQTTEPQVSTWLQKMKALGYPAIPLLFGKPNTVFVIITNWTKAKFCEVVNFSSAITCSDSSRSRESSTQGRVAYYHSQVMVDDPYQRRNFVNILGKDVNGNYWLNISVTPDAWERLEKDMGKAYMEI